MLGGGFDIIKLFKPGFYYWVIFRDYPIQYPDKNPVLGRYLGPAIDVVPKMTAKIMKVNGEMCIVQHTMG